MFPISRNNVSPPKEVTQAINYFRGINISRNATQIDDKESPDMINMLPDDRGALDKRKGIKNIFTSLGTGAIKCLIPYRKSTGTIYLFAHGAKLYKIDDLTLGTYTEIYSGLSSNTRIRGITFNDIFYFWDGTTYRQYNGTTVISVVGRIPVVTIGTPPTGGGTLFEQLNLISAGFTQRYSATGAATAYQLAYSGLDVTTVLVTLNGATLTEGVNFTVNRTTGLVTFTVAPTAGTNNLDITAFKTFAGNQDQIFKCTIPYVWGGADGTRIWISGNPVFKNRDWRSSLQDPTYWEANGFDDVGQNDNAITGYSRLYNQMLVIKERSTHTRSYIENAGEPEFPIATHNGDIGCIATDSIQILDNFPHMVTKKGVYEITSVEPFNERNVRHISDNIDKNANLLSIEGLLEMGNLEDYFGIDYNNQYWLFNPNNGIVWVYDYRYVVDGIGQWFKLTNIYANCALEIDGILYYGDSRKGIINKLKSTGEENIYNDTEGATDTPITTYWTSKIFNYNSNTNLKLVSSIFFTIKPASRTKASLYTRSDLRSVFNLIKTTSKSLFTYSLIKYSEFTYGGNDFPKQTKSKTKAKKIGYYQIKIENSNASESLGIIDVAFKIQYQREVKR